MSKFLTNFTESQVDRVRLTLRQIENSELPGPVRFGASLARRAGRSVILGVRSALRALGPKMIRRNILFPIRNLALGHKPLTVKADGQSFVLAPEGAVPLEMWSGRYFERQELEFVLSVLRPGMTFVDVGANVGLFSIPAAKKAPNGLVFAFEPCGWTYKRLLENVRLNGLTNVRTIHSALGDRTGEAILQINAAGKDGLNTIGKATHGESKVIGKERIPITRLDDFLRQHSVSHVDVMKMDVEGAELFVLRGASELLNKSDAPLLLYESSFISRGLDYHPVEQMWLLQKYGYSLFVLDSNSGGISTPPNGKAYDANVIAVKPSHPAYACVKGRVS